MYGQKPGIPSPGGPYRRQADFSADMTIFLKEIQSSIGKYNGARLAFLWLKKVEKAT